MSTTQTYTVASASQLGGTTFQHRLRHAKPSIGITGNSQPTQRSASINSRQAGHPAVLPRRTQSVSRSRGDIQATLNGTKHADPERAAATAQMFFTMMLTSDSTAELLQVQSPPTGHLKKPSAVDVKEALAGVAKPSLSAPIINKLVLTTEQLDQLVQAFTKSPLIRSALACQHLKYPAMDNKSKSVVPRLYTLPNRHFIEHKAHLFAPELSLINGQAYGVALVDSKDCRSSVRYTSHPTDEVQKGHPTGLYLPEELSSSITIHTQLCENGNSGDVVLQMVSSIIDRQTGRRSCCLSVEEEITRSVVKATIAEVARLNELPVKAIKVVKSAQALSNDWSAAVDELQASSEYADIVENNATAMRSLNAVTCTLQTLTLMSEIGKIRSASRDFLILELRKEDCHGNLKIAVPSMSRALYDSLEAVGRTQAFARMVAASVHPYVGATEGVAIRDSTNLKTSLRCIPLFEKIGQKPQAWLVKIEPNAKAVFLSREMAGLML